MSQVANFRDDQDEGEAGSSGSSGVIFPRSRGRIRPVRPRQVYSLTDSLRKRRCYGERVPTADLSRCSKLHERRLDLLDHLVGAAERGQQPRERLAGLEVDDQLELGRELSTTQRYRCWQKANAARGACGVTCVTTDPSLGRQHRQVYYYSPTGEGEHPQRQLANYTGIIQVDAYAGYDALYVEGRQPGPIIEAGCWSHGRRKHYELARLRKMPIAMEVVRRIDESSAKSMV